LGGHPLEVVEELLFVCHQRAAFRRAGTRAFVTLVVVGPAVAVVGCWVAVVTSGPAEFLVDYVEEVVGRRVVQLVVVRAVGGARALVTPRLQALLTTWNAGDGPADSADDAELDNASADDLFDIINKEFGRS
ncbi:hypothetical protein, partial [Saccharothrix sp. ST-888]|uniref:hypothetical protein n=1 Tax=Saccharothrix sp. ST-888 TaxID=1427391 RepID=UPI0005EC7B10